MIGQDLSSKRLNELRLLNIIDSGSEDEYDSIASLAAYICGTPIALITLLTKDRQYFKSHHGLEILGTPIDQSFCAHAILSLDEITIIDDARLDARFKDNPLVTGDPHIVFYAGAPLVTEAGIPLGTLSVIDREVKRLTESQIEALKSLATQIIRLLELRKTKIALKHSQLELADESVRLRNIIEATRVGTWEWNVQTGQIFINDRYAEIVGYTKEELEPANIDMWYKLVHPDDQLLSDTKIKDCFEKRTEYYDIECRLVHKDGRIVWVNDRGRVVSWTNDGKPMVMSGTHTEITEKKSAELRLSQTLDSLKERIKEQTCLYRIAKLYENTFDIDELLSKATNIIPSGWRYSRNAHARIVLGDKVFTSDGFVESSVVQEFSRYTIDGNILHLSVFYDHEVPNNTDSPFIVEEWDLIRMIVDNLVLIHDRKLADLRIAQNEKRYRNLVENGADAIAIIGADGSTKYVSPSISGVLGYTEAEAMRMNLFEIVHPDDVEGVKSLFSEVLEKPGIPLQGHTSRTLHKDGSWRWLEATVTNLIHDPAINGIIDNFRDVTDRVVSNRLDILERTVMELSTDIHFDLTNLLQQYSSGLENILPNTMVSIHGVVDGKLTQLAAPSLPADYVEKVVGESIGPDAGSCGTAAYRGELVIAEDIESDPLWVNYRDLAASFGLRACWSQPVIDSEKNVIATIANYYTEPKRPGSVELEVFKRAAALISLIMESYKKNQELLASNERYYYVNQATNDAIYDWDYVADIFYWGESFTRIFGHDLAETPFRLEHWVHLMHPDDNLQNVELWKQFLNDSSQHIWNKEFRFRKADDTYAHVEEKGYLIRDENGKPKRMIGVLRDQTVSKELEQQKKMQHQISGIFALDDRMAGILDQISRHISEFTHSDSVEIWLVNANNTSLSLFGSSYSDTLRPIMDGKTKTSHCNVGNGLAGSVYHTDMAVTHLSKEQLHLFLDENDPFYGQFDRVVGIPLYHIGATIGVMLIGTLSRQDQLDTISRQLTSLGNFLGSEIRRKQQEEEFRMFFDYAPEIMAIASPNGYFSKINTAFCTLLEMDEHEIVFKPFEELMHPDDYAETKKEYDETITGDRQSHNFINRYRTKSGAYKWISWSSSAVFGENGYVFAYGRDVSEMIKAQEDLKQLNQKLEMHAQELAISNRELEQFAYIASHDLQEPLRMITSFMSQLEKKYGPTLDDRAKKYIFYAVDGAKRMRQIILDLLEYSRVGKYDYNLESIPLNELINEVLYLDQSLIVEKGARVTVSNLPTIECYRPPLMQIFHNLIVNAVKYNRPGVPPDIDISATSSGPYWVISVKDNGIGINSEYFDKIFIIFQRLHSPGEYEGTGLGLAIVKKVVESLGGKISVTSDVGNGSTFKVMLPKKMP